MKREENPISTKKIKLFGETIKIGPEAVPYTPAKASLEEIMAMFQKIAVPGGLYPESSSRVDPT